MGRGKGSCGEGVTPAPLSLAPCPPQSFAVTGVAPPPTPAILASLVVDMFNPSPASFPLGAAAQLGLYVGGQRIGEAQVGQGMRRGASLLPPPPALDAGLHSCPRPLISYNPPLPPLPLPSPAGLQRDACAWQQHAAPLGFHRSRRLRAACHVRLLLRLP